MPHLYYVHTSVVADVLQSWGHYSLVTYYSLLIHASYSQKKVTSNIPIWAVTSNILHNTIGIATEGG